MYIVTKLTMQHTEKSLSSYLRHREGLGSGRGRGRHPGNMHRDLIAKMQKSVEMPQVYVASVPFWDHHKNRYSSNVAAVVAVVV